MQSVKVVQSYVNVAVGRNVIQTALVNKHLNPALLYVDVHVWRAKKPDLLNIILMSYLVSLLMS